MEELSFIVNGEVSLVNLSTVMSDLHDQIPKSDGTTLAKSLAQVRMTDQRVGLVVCVSLTYERGRRRS